MSKAKIVIIGGGAAGMMSGIVAAQNGAKVTILERKDKVGKKILATGNGTCNISNKKASGRYYHSENNDEGFFNNILKQFTIESTKDFFEDLGILMIEKEDGKLYPRAEQANSVVSALLFELNRLKVKIVIDSQVEDIIVDKKFKVITKEETFYGNQVIIAGGGQSSPDLGSNGSCFKLGKALGHQLVEPFPAIVQLKTDDPYLKHLKGTKVYGNVSVFNENKDFLRKEYGEVLFTDYGISGPPVLQVSRIAALNYLKGKNPYVSIDLIPEYTEDELDDLLIKRFTAQPVKTIEENLNGFIKKALHIPILKKGEIDIHKKSCDIRKEERNTIAHLLKYYKMNVSGINQWNQSQVTAGGISLKEVDSQSLESKIVPNLYFAGEVLDVDGDCGGYNLQWAWASGYVAGINASKRDK